MLGNIDLVRGVLMNSMFDSFLAAMCNEALDFSIYPPKVNANSFVIVLIVTNVN